MRYYSNPCLCVITFKCLKYFHRGNFLDFCCFKSKTSFTILGEYKCRVVFSYISQKDSFLLKKKKEVQYTVMKYYRFGG